MNRKSTCISGVFSLVFLVVMLTLIYTIPFPPSHASPSPSPVSAVPVTCDHWTPINTTANVRIIQGNSSVPYKTYICSIELLVGTATNVAIVEGTGSTCGTNTAGMAGGATAATGYNFGANGGIAHGSGIGAIMVTATPQDDVCVLVSAANQVSGVIGWTQQ